MGEVILLYKGKAVRNFQVYYLKSDNYIAEFDTDDGHYIEGVRTSTPPYIRGDVELGVIDENGDIIPINQLFEKTRTSICQPQWFCLMITGLITSNIWKAGLTMI